MNNTGAVLYNVMMYFRAFGLIGIAIAGMWAVFSEVGKGKENMSMLKTLSILAGTLVAAIVFIVLPTMVNYIRSDFSTIVPDHPIGGYR
ncbi:hypothetical protein F3087_40200 [Nocardia colli]|uniref:Uncharacterized protein n=1 Tax=Nocardia colli TaxID=2545717 RepID=A0A5N0DYW5_9NOCA|nr:hypothetical protein [Nocardia colli]KAA8881893.1 hypothetical protein F3087_40200 [Nocardia colli]